MTIREDNRVYSDLAIPPGELLEEEIAAICMTQHELAERTGRPLQAINEIIRGKKAITHQTALQLENVLGIPAHVWVNLQSTYDLTNARKNQLEELQGQEEWLKEFPVSAMEKRGWIAKHTAKSERVLAVLSFLGFTSFDHWRKTSTELLGFRISQGSKVSFGALSVWIRKGEMEAQSTETAPYSESRFHDALAEIRNLTKEGPEIFEPRIKDLCAEAGVVVVFVRELPKSGANGMARWITKEKGLIQISLKYRWGDVFWFTFFHEACHILRHQLRDVHIDGIDGDSDAEEEANQFACDVLIPQDSWNEFVETTPLTSGNIINFSEELGIAPGIIIGRLQHEKLIPYNHLNNLRERFVWKEG